MAANVRAYLNQTATIANGQTTSGPIPCVEYAAATLQLPAAFTGTSLSFLVSMDGVTYTPLQNAQGQLLSLTVAPGNAYAIPADVLACAYFKIVSGSSEGGARSILVFMKG